MHRDAHAHRWLAPFRHRKAVVLALVISVAPIAGVLIDAERAAGAAPTWQLTPTPDPAGSSGNSLNSVSCVNANNCFAVGTTDEGIDQTPLVEHWNGIKWSRMRAPSRGNISGLWGVACVNASRCIAVGNFVAADGRFRQLIAAWNGTTWSFMPTPTPAGSTSTFLGGIACPAANSCFAVGAASTSAGQKPLAEHWNGRTWSVMDAPNPATTTSAGLSGVSCPTRTNCFAVGSVLVTGEQRTLAAYWNGSTWKLQPMQNPGGAQEPVLHGVSCPSRKHCFAVGNQIDAPAVTPLVEQWNGNAWKIVATPRPSDDSTQVRRSRTLNGVTCTGASNCFAVGRYISTSSGKTLVEHWNGNRWKVQPSPSPSVAPSLSSVSCSSATTCFAVGSETDYGTVAMRYK